MNRLGNPATLAAPPEYTELPCVFTASRAPTLAPSFAERHAQFTPLATETPEVALMDGYGAEMGG